MGNEFRLAVRRLRQQPGFTLVAVATLALGLGVNTAIFTIANALAAQELPVRDPQGLYRIGSGNNCCVNSGLQDNYSLFATRMYLHFRASLSEFQSLAAFQANVTATSVRRSGTIVTESIPAQYVSANYFDTLGVTPHLGRLLEPADDDPSRPTAFVISHRTWLTRFGGDPAVVGAGFIVAGKPATLVGVTGERFYGETVRPNPAGVWLPLGHEPVIRGASALLDRVESDWLYIMGRLAPGATPEAASTKASLVLRQWLGAQAFLSAADREELPLQQTQVIPAPGGVQTLRMGFARPVTILMWMSGLVLLIAAANLANLLLARADRGQAAVRVAMGASPLRLVRQSLAEGILLAVAGGALGMLVAAGAMRAIVALAFPNVEFLPIDLAPGGRVLLFSLALALITGALFSSLPAWAMSRTDPIDALRGTGRGGSARGFMPRRTLVVVQVAVSMVLLIGAGLLGETLRRLENQRLGFDPAERVVAYLNPPAMPGPAAEIGRVYDRILENVRRIPGVAGATYALYTPMEQNNYQGTFHIAGYQSADGRLPNAPWNRVGPGYFQLLGTRVTRGRAFDDRDMQPDSRSVIISETLANRYFPGENPIGRRMGRGGPEHAGDLEIVGVVEDVKYTNATQPVRPMYFMPGMQWIPYESEAALSTQARFLPARALVLRLNGPAPSLQPALRNALAVVHPDFSLTRVVTMPDQVGANFRINRMLSRLTTAYGLLALALAILGVYGVTAYGVKQRTREIGVRIALGAARARVVRDVMRGALVQAALGVAAGAVAAFFAARSVASFLFDIDARDPFVIGAACAVLVVCAGAAAALPAWRASGISPTEALKSE